jgi:hypothetical protein
LKKVGKTKIQEMSASNNNIFVLNSNNKRLIVNELVTHTSHPIEFQLFSLNSEANNEQIWNPNECEQTIVRQRNENEQSKLNTSSS